MRAPLLAIIAILTFAWFWGQFLEYVSWKIRSRRMWREIRKRL